MKLRIAALVVTAAGLAASLWLAMGSPGGMGSGDPYYRLAYARQLLPFAGASAGVALMVLLASRTGRARGRFASIALWWLLLGAVLLLTGIAVQILIASSPPGQVIDYDSPAMEWQQRVMMLQASGALSLVGGFVVWIASYRLDRRPG